MDDQTAANVLIEEANAALAADALDEAIALYRAAIDRFPGYASFNLVVGDALYDAGRLAEAIDAYELTVAAVPEHDQAWERLVECLARVGRVDDAARARGRLQELRAELRPGAADELVAQLRATTDINERARIICKLAYSLDDRVPRLLHEWLGEVELDRRTARRGSGNTFWSAVAFVLVRFGMAEFVDWYTDGPAPNQDWLMADVTKYLHARRQPPPAEEQQPITMVPPVR